MKAIYGLSTAMMEGLALEPALDALVRAGFRQVELMSDEGHLGGWVRDPASMRRALQTAGLTVRSVHSPEKGWNNGDLDEAARRASIEIAAASFAPAAEVGAEVVICHPNNTQTPYTLETFEFNLARSRDSLAMLAERARGAGVKMAVENLPARGLPRPGASVADVLRIIAGLGAHVGVCLDAGHSNANRISPAIEALEAGDKLMALHIQDNDGGGGDLHWVPGRGTTDWEAFFAALECMAFAGVRTIEVNAKAGFEQTLAAVAELRRQWESR